MDWIIAYQSLDGGLASVSVAGHIDLDTFRENYQAGLKSDDARQFHVDTDLQDIEYLADLTPRHGYYSFKCGAQDAGPDARAGEITKDDCKLRITRDAPGFESAECSACQHECLWGMLDLVPPDDRRSWPVTYVDVNKP